MYAHISCNDARQICLCTWSSDSISRNVIINYLDRRQNILSDTKHKPEYFRCNANPSLRQTIFCNFQIRTHHPIFYIYIIGMTIFTLHLIKHKLRGTENGNLCGILFSNLTRTLQYFIMSYYFILYPFPFYLMCQN